METSRLNASTSSSGRIRDQDRFGKPSHLLGNRRPSQTICVVIVRAIQARPRTMGQVARQIVLDLHPSTVLGEALKAQDQLVFAVLVQITAGGVGSVPSVSIVLAVNLEPTVRQRRAPRWQE